MPTPLERRLLKQIGTASLDFGLIEPNDRILVAVSGGKDSYGMLHLLRLLSGRTPFPFSIVAVNLDQGHPGFPADTLRSYFEKEGYDYKMLRQDTYKVVLEKIPVGKTYCSLCSRMRRGILYNAAVDLGCTKIALGHHRDDVIHTLLLNMLYGGALRAMPARLVSDDKRNVVIRPLVYCEEADLVALADEQQFPIIPCDLCGSQDNLQRKRISRLVADLTRDNPHAANNLFAAATNVVPSHLLDVRLLDRPDPVALPDTADGCGADEWATFGER
jgi:tRNA 2-thiocytidine biosynthesis protein TtcA